MTIPELKNIRKLVCKEYIDKFCKKQDLKFDGWLGNVIGSVACFNESTYSFKFEDICFDLETRQKHNAILRWHDLSTKINYKTFLENL